MYYFVHQLRVMLAGRDPTHLALNETGRACELTQTNTQECGLLPLRSERNRPTERKVKNIMESMWEGSLIKAEDFLNIDLCGHPFSHEPQTSETHGGTFQISSEDRAYEWKVKRLSKHPPPPQPIPILLSSGQVTKKTLRYPALMKGYKSDSRISLKYIPGLL